MEKILKIILLAIASICLTNTIKAQCSVPCPPLFAISDSIGCNNVEARKLAPGSGYNNLIFPIKSCKNTMMKYTIAVDPTCYAGTTYSLIGISGGTLLNFVGNMFTVQWGASNVGNVSIEFITPGGAGLSVCRDTLNLTFNLLNKPVAVFVATPQPACFNNPTTISFNSTGTLNATNYFWNFGDGFTSTLANPTHAYTLPGTYTVTLIVSNSPPPVNGQPSCPTCIDSVQHNVIINNLPGPDITCVATVCVGATKKYCTTASGCSSYIWSVIGGTISSGQGTSCVTVQWGAGTPQGSLTLVATGCTITYCPQGTTVNIPIVPAVGVISGAILACVNTYETYTLPAWPGTTYAWTLSSGGSITPFNSNTNQIGINWTTIGNHIITCNYYDSLLKCGGTANYNVFVRPILSITGPSSICASQTSNLISVRPTNIPVASNWVITPAGAIINSGNGTSTINVTWGNTTAFPIVYGVTATAVLPNTVCSNASYQVTVFPKPVLSAIIGKDSICPGKAYVYSATSNAVGLYNWVLNNAASFSLLGVNNDSIQVTWGPTGPYSVTVNQSSIPNNCLSNTLIKNIFAYPNPIITGPTSVCADQNVTYNITNILNGNFLWYVTPASFGTILSGQGTASILIKWHGNNSPGSSNIVYLHFGVCNSDSIAITINEPPIPTITASGTLCGLTGITLSTGATGIFAWTGPGGPVGGNTPSISNINIPGNYVVQIQNFNGTGCTVTTNYNIPDIGRPIASISASNIVNYCLPNLPNMNLVAVNGPGYTFQWYNTAGIILGATNATLIVNNLTVAGTYTYYCVVTLGTCVVTSNIIVITISNCPPAPGCNATIGITSITGCNPFTLAVAVLTPPGAIINGTGNPTITHLEDNFTISGFTTRTYTSIGNKQVRICIDVKMPDNSICRICKDTVVNVTVAANFTKVVNCKSVSLFDASTVVFPAVINSYNWTVGTNPGNIAVPPIIASYNNNSIASPVLTITQSGSYIITQMITSGTCTVIHRDTVNIIIPNASFNVNNSCVGTTVNFNNLYPAPTNFWDFGDAATSYTSPTSHAYGAPGLFLITHIVTLANGCKDTAFVPIGIAPAPICTVTFSGPLTFCFGDSVILGSSCTGLVNYQWYNNGVAIAGANFATDTVKQTGNYSFIAFDINGCKIISDTVAVTVNQAPNVAIISSGSVCFGSTYTVTVPSCGGCSYQWLVDGNPVGNTNQFSSIVGIAPFTVGTHNIFVQVVNSLGCTDTSSINVTFYALPTISISVVGPTPYCSNNLYTLNATSNAASPSWAWQLNNIGIVLSTSNSLLVSAAGNYTVKVTDGITGCSNTAVQTILPSPELNLFPIGCDTICDTAKIFLPLQSFNGNLTGYTINWYDNAPPYGLPVGNGISFPLNTLIPIPGNHNLSVIVTSPNGCMDTSNVYSIYVRTGCLIIVPIKSIILKANQVGELGILNWTTEQEIDNDYFIVEQSMDGISFSSAGKEWSKGNSMNKQFYTFNIPINSFNKTIFYRIKAVGKNGKFDYSNIVTLNPTKPIGESITILPNVTNSNANAILQSNANLQSQFIIYRGDGAKVSTQMLTLKKGANTIAVNLANLSAGLYFVTATTNEKKLTAMVIKK
jgi:PKD repeat protein